MIQLPETGFLRIHQIIGDQKRGIPSLIPLGRTAWLEGVRRGKFPQPVKLGARAVGWRVEEIRELISKLGKGK